MSQWHVGSSYHTVKRGAEQLSSEYKFSQEKYFYSEGFRCDTYVEGHFLTICLYIYLT